MKTHQSEDFSMSQIAGLTGFFSYSSERWGEDSNKTLPFYWNKPLLSACSFMLLPERCAQIFSFHDEIVDRVDNPSNVLLDNWAFI
jgi:hypothetical protein